MESAAHEVIRQELRQKSIKRLHSTIHLRTCTLEEVQQGSHPTPRFNHAYDPRMNPEHKEHHELSWMSCVFQDCKTHRTWKEAIACYPICIPSNSYENPYELYDGLEYYEQASPYYVITELAYYEELYKRMADYTRKIFEIVPWNRKAQKANENLTPEAVRQLVEHETSIAPHNYEEFKTTLSCGYNHTAY